jgi:hypothetical protein
VRSRARRRTAPTHTCTLVGSAGALPLQPGRPGPTLLTASRKGDLTGAQEESRSAAAVCRTTLLRTGSGAPITSPLALCVPHLQRVSFSWQKYPACKTPGHRVKFVRNLPPFLSRGFLTGQPMNRHGGAGTRATTCQSCDLLPERARRRDIPAATRDASLLSEAGASSLPRMAPASPGRRGTAEKSKYPLQANGRWRLALDTFRPARWPRDGLGRASAARQASRDSKQSAPASQAPAQSSQTPWLRGEPRACHQRLRCTRQGGS